MKKFSFALLIAAALMFTTYSCEEEQQAPEQTKQEASLKSVMDPQVPAKMTLHPTYTMTQSTGDSPPVLSAYVYGTEWFKRYYGLEPDEYDYAGNRTRTDVLYTGTGSIECKSIDDGDIRTLFRVEPTLDPVGYDGHVSFLVKGNAGEILQVATVVCCADEGGNENIIPDSQEETSYYWHWQEQDGVYIHDPNSFTLTGEWQYIEIDVANEWWEVASDNPGADFDSYPPYDDDVYVCLYEVDDRAHATFVDFIINGQISDPTPIGSYTIPGELNPTVGLTYTYTLDVDDMGEYSEYEWSISQSSMGTITQGQGTNQVKIKMNYTGNAIIYVRAKFNQMGWSAWKAKGIVIQSSTPPPPPPQPTITGASTLSGSKPIISSYSMPSGKQAYEWNLPYGTYSVQQYNNIKVIGFSSAGTRTIQGRYKSGGVWSDWGYKTVYVY